MSFPTMFVLPATACVPVSFLSLLMDLVGFVCLRIASKGTLARSSLLEQVFRFQNKENRALELFGFLILYVALVLKCVPMLPQATSDADSRMFHCIQTLILPASWLLERFILQFGSLPPLQNFLVVWIFFGCVLYRLGEPRRFDSLTLQDEVMGCDGGYRLWFRLYCCIFVTLAVLGVMALFPSDDVHRERFEAIDSSSGDDKSGAAGDSAAEVDYGPPPSALRKKISPFLWGGAVSAASVLLEAGAVANRTECSLAGMGLLFLCAVLHWDALCRSQLTLGSWVPATMMFLCFVRYLQGICMFSDFRWAGPDEASFFSVPMEPGVWYMSAGVVLFSITYPIYIEADDTVEWGSRDEPEMDSTARTQRQATLAALARVRRPARVLVVLILPICMVTMYLGLTTPMMSMSVSTPQVLLVSDSVDSVPTTTTKASALAPNSKSTGGASFLRLIPNSYRGGKPLSAISVIWLGFRAPTMLFVSTIVLLVRPKFVTDYFLAWSRDQIVNGASARFINPMINMLAIAWLNYSDPGHGSVKFTFGSGFWYLVAHAFAVVFMALAVEVDADKLDRHATIEMKRFQSDPIVADSSSADSDVIEADFMKAGSIRVIVLTCVAAVSIWIGITNPFLIIQVRVEGVVTAKSAPNLLDLWYSLEEASGFVGTIVAGTVLFAMLVWVPVLLLSLRFSSSRWARICEKTVRQWVMGHHWMTALLLPYMILSMQAIKPNAIVEACYQVPMPPYGPLGVVVMGVCCIILQGIARKLANPLGPAKQLEPGLKRNGIKIPKLPGGNIWWYLTLVFVFVCTFVYLLFSAPAHSARVLNLVDVNQEFHVAMLYVNEQMKRRVPEAVGDCSSLAAYRAKAGITVHAITACHGDKPLANKTAGSVEFSAKWISGLDTIRLTRAELLKDPGVDSQQWKLFIDGEFTNLQVWLKIELNSDVVSTFINPVWFDDNMCCTNPFHFTIEAAAECIPGRGFSKLEMDLPHLDAIEIKHSVDEGDKGYYETNYGSYSIIQEALRKVFKVKSSSVRVQMGDGSITNPMVYISEILNQVLELNTGHHCPQGQSWQ